MFRYNIGETGASCHPSQIRVDFSTVEYGFRSDAFLSILHILKAISKKESKTNYNKTELRCTEVGLAFIHS